MGAGRAKLAKRGSNRTGGPAAPAFPDGGEVVAALKERQGACQAAWSGWRSITALLPGTKPYSGGLWNERLEKSRGMRCRAGGRCMGDRVFFHVRGRSSSLPTQPGDIQRHF